MVTLVMSQRRQARLTATAILGAAALAFGLISVTPAVAAPPGRPSAPPAVLDKGFVDVSAVSPSDAWRITFVQNAVGKGRELLEHWDGTRWRSVPHPRASIRFGSLDAIDARTTDDVWAVGAATNNQGGETTRAEHWDGQAWTAVSTPGDGSPYDLLTSVSADADDDAWAVGFGYGPGEADQGLAEHWDGNAWELSALPATVQTLTSVDALTPTDAWAVGRAVADGGYVDVVLHWDGSGWSIADSQARTHRLWHLYSSVVALADDDVWVFGTRFLKGKSFQHHTWPYARHFDGSVWSDVPTAQAVHGSHAQFAAAAPDGAGGLWAVGGQYTEYADEESPLIEHWDGTRWQVEPVPSMPIGEGLEGVSAGGPTSAWAVGGSKIGKPLDLVWDGTVWHR